MGLRIGTNTTAAGISRFLRSSQKEIEHAYKSLASGNRIVDAGDDAAGFAISESLRGQISGLRQARQNSENAASLIQVAEGGLNEQNNILMRLRELSVQSASDTVSEKERTFLNSEFSQLVEEFDRIARTTQYGSKKLLSGNVQRYEFQIGPNAGSENILKYTLDTDTTSTAMNIDSLNIEDQYQARDSLQYLDEAVYKISGARAQFGAIQSRLDSTRSHLDMQIENTESARSKIVDADIAETTAKLATASIKQNMAIAVLAQANQKPEMVTRLI